MRKLTLLQQHDILARVKKGEKVIHVAKLYGVSNHRVWAICNNNGVSIQRINLNRQREIADYVATGVGMEDAIEHLGIGMQAITNACREFHVTVPPRGRGGTSKTLLILRSLIDAPYGCILQTIADEHGISRQRVHQVWMMGVSAGFFNDTIWTIATGKSPKPEHMKVGNNGKAS